MKPCVNLGCVFDNRKKDRNIRRSYMMRVRWKENFNSYEKGNEEF